MRTSELTGAALDWAVAKAEGAGAALVSTRSRGEVLLLSDPTEDCDAGEHYAPSTNWAQGGPIIEREMREFGFDLWSGAHVPDGQFAATYCRGAPDSYVYGPTPLIAAMRCFVASRLGDEVDVPEELT